jgi:hypothetical protein
MYCVEIVKKLFKICIKNDKIALLRLINNKIE